MSDPPLSDIDFKNKMTWISTTLNFSETRIKMFQDDNSLQKGSSINEFLNVTDATSF